MQILICMLRLLWSMSEMCDKKCYHTQSGVIMKMVHVTLAVYLVTFRGLIVQPGIVLIDFWHEIQERIDYTEIDN